MSKFVLLFGSLCLLLNFAFGSNEKINDSGGCNDELIDARAPERLKAVKRFFLGDMRVDAVRIHGSLGLRETFDVQHGHPQGLEVVELATGRTLQTIAYRGDPFDSYALNARSYCTGTNANSLVEFEIGPLAELVPPRMRTKSKVSLDEIRRRLNIPSRTEYTGLFLIAENDHFNSILNFHRDTSGGHESSYQAVLKINISTGAVEDYKLLTIPNPGPGHGSEWRAVWPLLHIGEEIPYQTPTRSLILWPRGRDERFLYASILSNESLVQIDPDTFKIVAHANEHDLISDEIDYVDELYAEQGVLHILRNKDHENFYSVVDTESRDLFIPGDLP